MENVFQLIIVKNLVKSQEMNLLKDKGKINKCYRVLNSKIIINNALFFKRKHKFKVNNYLITKNKTKYIKIQNFKIKSKMIKYQNTKYRININFINKKLKNKFNLNLKH